MYLYFQDPITSASDILNTENPVKTADSEIVHNHPLDESSTDNGWKVVIQPASTTSSIIQQHDDHTKDKDTLQSDEEGIIERDDIVADDSDDLNEDVKLNEIPTEHKTKLKDAG